MSYSVREVARILRVSPARLRYWERTALWQASAREDAQPSFAFHDLVGLRSVLALLEGGVPLRRIRRTLDAVRARIPDLERPLGALRVCPMRRGWVLVRHDGLLLEPDGQLVLELQPAAAPGLLALAPRGAARLPEGPRSALEWFERGCALDSDPASYEPAVEAYQRALALDPTLADAHCNLGTVHYNRGQRAAARGCYERALGLEPEHVEANFNLANLLEEEERNEAALRHYKAAMRGDPLYADVQLNLALLYEKLGLRRKARDHWRRYLQLDPGGAWADVARKHLGD